jgi:hypothetical protein
LIRKTLVLPEIAPMIGRDVCIIVVEESALENQRTDLAALDRLAGNIDLDYRAIENLRARSLI